MPVLPLTDAVQKGDLARVLRILRESRGADPDEERDDDVGLTALHWAARDGRLDVVAALLACGANPTVADRDGNTAHDYAKRMKREDVLALFDALTVKPKKAAVAKPERATKARGSSGGVEAHVVDHEGRTEIVLPPALAKTVKPGRVKVRVNGSDKIFTMAVAVGSKIHVRIVPRVAAALDIGPGMKVKVEVERA